WLAAELTAQDPGLPAAECARALVGAARAQAALARRDTRVQEELERALPLEADALRVVPLFADEVRAGAALARIARQIFGAPDGWLAGARAAPLAAGGRGARRARSRHRRGPRRARAHARGLARAARGRGRALACTRARRPRRRARRGALRRARGGVCRGIGA